MTTAREPASGPATATRPRPRLVAIGTAVAAILVLAVAMRPGSSDATPATSTAVSTATAAVERRDLVVTEELSGELAYADRREVTTRRDGIVTSVAAAGTTVTSGQALFAVDLEPTVVLVGAGPAYRALDRDTSGDDVQQLEQALVELGYGDGLTVDTDFTGGTAEAVERWESDLGRDDPDGEVALGDVVFAPDGVRVSQASGYVGAAVSAGQTVVTVTSTMKVVELDLDADRSDVVEAGSPVSVTLPDRTEVAGTVRSVGTEPETDAADPGAESTVPVVVTLADTSAAFDSGSVQVTVESSRDDDVLAVPVTALLALAEGGYAVELAEDGGLVAVEIGTVADGWVAVDGELAEGAEVVVPA